jgi:hypothetical protein
MFSRQVKRHLKHSLITVNQQAWTKYSGKSILNTGVACIDGIREDYACNGIWFPNVKCVIFNKCNYNALYYFASKCYFPRADVAVFMGSYEPDYPLFRFRKVYIQEGFPEPYYWTAFDMNAAYKVSLVEYQKFVASLEPVQESAMIVKDKQ